MYNSLFWILFCCRYITVSTIICRSYLVDLIETVHLFLKMLEHYCKKTGLVVQKKVKKKSKTKSALNLYIILYVNLSNKMKPCYMIRKNPKYFNSVHFISVHF